MSFKLHLFSLGLKQETVGNLLYCVYFDILNKILKESKSLISIILEMITWIFLI